MFLHCLAKLVYQDVDDGFLQRCGKVCLVFLYEVGVFLHLVAEGVEKRCLQSAETVVKAWDMGLAELKPGCVALGCQTVDVRTAGIRQPHHLGALVKRLSGCVVDCLPEYFHIVVVFNDDNLRVAARNQQTHIWKLRHFCALVLFYEMRQHMPVQVVDTHHRDVERGGKSFGKRGADKQ